MTLSPPSAAREVTLLDLLDRLLQGGVVVKGEITLAAADIDLVNLNLQLLVAATDTLEPRLEQPAQPRRMGA